MTFASLLGRGFLGVDDGRNVLYGEIGYIVADPELIVELQLDR